ncbi:MAG: general secretion pathway protein GspB [Candidatus Thiodiazotropha sp.]
MSSILDALERASQERMPGKTDILPDTTSLPDENHSALRRWLVLAILLLLIVAIFWFLFTDHAGKPETPRQIEQQEPTPTKQQATQARVQDTSAGATQKNKPTVQKERLTAERIRSSGQPNQRPLVSEAMLSQKRQPKKISDRPEPARMQQAQTPPRQTVKESTRSQSPLPAVVPKAPLPRVVAKGDAVKEKSQQGVTVSDVDDKQVAAVESRVNEAADAEQMEQQQIPLIWEMDQALREELEQLNTTIHVYHEKPAQRFVIINMRRYSEGDTLGVNGYRLHAIDRDGIVVDYGDGLVRLLRDKY